MKAPRDPAALARVGGLLLATVVLWPLAVIGEFRPWVLFEAQNLRVMGGFLGGFLPPASGGEFLAYLGQATIETLAMASAGIALAFVVAVPLAVATTQALSISRLGPGPGRRRGELLRAGLRILLVVLRGIPELVWALLFVRVLGLGPAAGVLALGLTYGGMLAKVYAEILESGDQRPARALLEAGGSRLQALCYGLLPGVAQELTSYTVYRWECAVRASVVMGFVGAGGLGQLMDQSMKMLNGGEAASILLTFLALVLAADALSAFFRRQLGEAGTAGHAAALGPLPLAILASLGGAVLASFAWLDLGLGALLSRAAAASIADFFASFWPLDLSAGWLWKVGQGALETLAISVLGTLLATVCALLLALPASGRHGALLEQATRFVLNALRSVPELVWATLMALAAGLGPFAGILALALHTSGVLGRLFAEALQNAPATPRDALLEAGTPAGVAFLYGSLPTVTPQLLAYALYRWEMNIRMAAILGFVGAGGLGQLLYVELSLFHQAQASTVIAAMLLLSVAVDAASASLRRRLG
ncbi:MAG: ABC transporter permease subunit [Candidatus Accumulibacter sp.]|uniref:PhnE/PtxC family ABC transporter permease n=1 Tax=Accumulibacter sp. TaxID=2053492 RepID=UPI0019F2DF19|nr:ABC transporter permease subunit [Accumulibacter sp.]MBE2261064.1 ABC transporter permease subunit [Paracoccaceae bacterium]MCP5247942.1 ABC transporter permease subunit [Accumulibacter sp.]